MTKSELIDSLIDQHSSVSVKAMNEYVKCIVSTIADSLANDDLIEIRDFGCFTPRFHPVRRAYNPRKKEWMMTPAKTLPHFKAGKALRENVDMNRETTPIKDCN